MHLRRLLHLLLPVAPETVEDDTHEDLEQLEIVIPDERNIASIAEDPRIIAEYCRNELQLASGLTKIITPAEWPHTMVQFSMTASSDVSI